MRKEASLIILNEMIETLFKINSNNINCYYRLWRDYDLNIIKAKLLSDTFVDYHIPKECPHIIIEEIIKLM